MLPGPLENVAAVHGAVVVDEHDISLLHRHVHLVLLGDLIDVLEILLGDLRAISVEHVRLVEAAGTSGLRKNSIPLVSECGRVGVDVAEPGREARVGVEDHRGLGGSMSLNDALAIDTVPKHVDLEVNLHVNDSSDDSLENWLQDRLQRTRLVQKAHGELSGAEADLLLIEALENLRVKIPEHPHPVGDDELSSHLCCLEAHKRGAAHSALAHHLIVHADIELGAGGLVHGLIDSAVPAHHRSACHRVQGIQASLHAESFPHALEALGLLSEIEPLQDDSSVLLQVGEDALLVLCEVTLLSVQVPEVSRLGELEGEAWQVHLLHLLLQLQHVKIRGPPLGDRAGLHETFCSCSLLSLTFTDILGTVLDLCNLHPQARNPSAASTSWSR
mmetsp:Transcript_14836/g.34103  ORF Transcript_14836/g.34103 Transcript_14836/m.34103 type:complete len:388 (-) Transcript_14836:288-1451(-)